jgi:ferredoxin
MADKTKRLKDNVPGPFYVDEQCSGCFLCCQTAPDHFKEAGDRAVVGRQPVTEEERNACKEALEACPEQAIGDDGEA